MPDPHPSLTPETADRARRVLMAMACGEALGAPYESGPPLTSDHQVGMVGGGTLGWEPGEWTDDTSMAVVIFQAAEAAQAASRPLTDHLDDVARGWADWARTATDVGIPSRSSRPPIASTPAPRRGLALALGPACTEVPYSHPSVRS